jgi:hypothetical protein
MATSAPPPTAPSGRSTADLVKDVLAGTQTMVRQELELARLELMEGVAAKGQAAGAGAAAGVLALYVVGFLGLAGGAALSQVVPAWLAWLIVAGVFLLLTALAGLVARARARSAPLGVDKTKASIEEDVAWAKRLIRR